MIAQRSCVTLLRAFPKTVKRCHVLEPLWKFLRCFTFLRRPVLVLQSHLEHLRNCQKLLSETMASKVIKSAKGKKGGTETTRNFQVRRLPQLSPTRRKNTDLLCVRSINPSPTRS